MLTPKQISETLTVPASTLRRWSKRFSNNLTPHKPHTHRTYTTSDLETLRRIRDFLEAGLTYEEIEPKLDLIEPTENEKAIISLIDFNQVLEQSRASIQKMQAQIDSQAERLEKLETYLPILKKILKKIGNTSRDLQKVLDK